MAQSLAAKILQNSNFIELTVDNLLITSALLHRTFLKMQLKIYDVFLPLVSLVACITKGIIFFFFETKVFFKV